MKGISRDELFVFSTCSCYFSFEHSIFKVDLLTFVLRTDISVCMYVCMYVCTDEHTDLYREGERREIERERERHIIRSPIGA